MASGASFQLFPPPASKNRESNPFRKASAQRMSKRPISVTTIVEDSNKVHSTIQQSPDGVFIQVFKEISPVREPVKAHVAGLPFPPAQPASTITQEAMKPAKSTKKYGKMPMNPPRLDTQLARASLVSLPPPPPRPDSIITQHGTASSNSTKTLNNLPAPPPIGNSNTRDSIGSIASIPPPPPRPESMIKLQTLKAATVRNDSTLLKSPPQTYITKKSSPLARSDSRSTSGTPSPIVTMKSMFPRYNPKIPLTKQAYFPQHVRKESLPERSLSRTECSPTVASISKIDELVGGPKTAPASVLDFPLDVLEVQAPTISTIQELGILWEAANGQGPEVAMGSFSLKMSRMAEATFSFGSSPNAPFYTLETFSNNELSVSRTHPFKSRIKIPILQLSLESPNYSSHQPHVSSHKGREMITYIFPKLAAMLAIDQSDTLALHHHLAPSEKIQMQSEAVTRAAAQEASRLYWNEVDCRYELAHPAIGRDQPKSPRWITSTVTPTTPPVNPAKQVLHITINNPQSNPPSSESAPHSPTYPTIMITNPNPPPATTTTTTSASSSPPLPSRASTVPNPDTTNDTIPAPLVYLTLHPSTPTLYIDTHSITTLLPSLYAIDSLVSALFAVAVADRVSNTVMADMPIYDPTSELQLPNSPTSIRTPLMKPSPKPSHTSSTIFKTTSTPTLYATLAERQEAEEEATLMRQLHQKDLKNNHHPRSHTMSLATSLRSISAALNGKLDEAQGIDTRSPDSDYDLDILKHPVPNSTAIQTTKAKKSKSKTQRVTIEEFDLEKYGTYQSGSRAGQKLPAPSRWALNLMFECLRVLVWFLTLFVRVVAWVLVGVTRGVSSERF